MPEFRNIMLIQDGQRIGHCDDDGRWFLDIDGQSVALAQLRSTIDALEAALNDAASTAGLKLMPDDE